MGDGASHDQTSDPGRRPPQPPHHGERQPEGWHLHPAPSGRGRPPARPPAGQGKPAGWRIAVGIALFLAFEIWVIASLGSDTTTRVRVPYTPTFLAQLRDGNVAQISPKGESVTGRFRSAVRYPDRGDQEPASAFETEIPTFADTAELARLIDEHDVVVEAEPAGDGTSTFVSLLVGIAPVLVIFALLAVMMRRGGVGAAGAFTRSRTRRVEPAEQHLTFADVAGIDEAKTELAEIVDFLRAPEKYRRLGGRIPRGVLLTGPPGTGKTLLARALAGEAEVPFFSIAASEFVELYVGVGASRVRDLFVQAKQAAPAIVFIDELDAIGRSRNAGIGSSGGSEEREQTLNQILTEMDGFDTSIGVIVLAATNRPEILDRALLRPGRFDRRVAIQPPDTDGRRAILVVHTRGMPLASDVDLGALAAQTSGMVGADLANVVNEAALLAARRDREQVAMEDFAEALEKLLLGSERRIRLGPEERRRTAHHEAGHALVAMLTPGADPVRKVSIIPHGAALGVTLSAPDADRFSYDRAYLTAKLAVLMGGRAAEELRYREVTTGAEDDLRQATELARSMVGRWGMSERLGPLVVLGPAGEPRMPGEEPSPELLQVVDEEVRRLLDETHDRVVELLRAHGGRLDALADALLRDETLDADAARRAADLTAAPDLAVEA